MSDGCSVYCGAFIEMTYPARVTRKVKALACDNDQCRLHKAVVTDQTARFCKLCGTSIDAGEREETTSQSVRDILADCGNRDSGISEHCDITTYPIVTHRVAILRGHNTSESHELSCYGDWKEFKPDAATEGVRQFSEDYADEISKLKQHLGDDNVKVVWGVLVVSH